MELEFIPAKRPRTGKPYMLFSKTGLITVSPKSVEDHGITDRHFLNVARDKGRPQDWYLVISEEESLGGIAVRKKHPSNKQKGIIFNCSSWSKQFISEFGNGEKSVSVPLAVEGEEIMDGRAKAVAIITKALDNGH